MASETYPACCPLTPQNTMRVPGAFAYRIPEALDSAIAAPLLCAGITVGRRCVRSSPGYSHHERAPTVLAVPATRSATPAASTRQTCLTDSAASTGPRPFTASLAALPPQQVYAPLRKFIKRPGMNVGILGVGGLGHLAVQFAVSQLTKQGQTCVCCCTAELQQSKSADCPSSSGHAEGCTLRFRQLAS